MTSQPQNSPPSSGQLQNVVDAPDSIPALSHTLFSYPDEAPQPKVTGQYWAAFPGMPVPPPGASGNPLPTSTEMSAGMASFVPTAGPSNVAPSQDQPQDAQTMQQVPEQNTTVSTPASPSDSPNASSKGSIPLDPSAPAFLAEMLGPAKWASFSAKLFERRLGGPKARELKKKRQQQPQRGNQKGKQRDGDEGEGGAEGKDGATSATPPAGTSLTGRSSHGATVIEFLIKAEVVKEVLRTYVPHPYNPLKSLAHPWAGSPTGAVVLTRPAVLKLSGWSNTQFSYWARRSEAVACLSQYDERLQKVRAILESRMARGEWMVNTTNQQADIQSAAAMAAVGINPSAIEDIITGKGLDAVIEQIKKRTGASQFIRGKHASLDPFGTVLGDDFAHGLGNPNNVANRLPLPTGITMGMTTGFNIPGGIAVPALTGAGGGGGVRITDIRKRVAEAKTRGEPVPEEWLRAEQQAAAFSEAKVAGKGKRGPGKSKGLAGGDNHGSGSVQDQLTAAAIIDAMQRGVFVEFDKNGDVQGQQTDGALAQTPGAGPSGAAAAASALFAPPHPGGVPRPITEKPYDDIPQLPAQPTPPESGEKTGQRQTRSRQSSAAGQQQQPSVPLPYDHQTLAQHAQAHAQDHTHPTHLPPLPHGTNGGKTTHGRFVTDDVDGVMLDPGLQHERPPRTQSSTAGASALHSNLTNSSLPGGQSIPSASSSSSSLNHAFATSSFAMDLPSMGLSLPIPTLPMPMPGTPTATHHDPYHQESIVATSSSAVASTSMDVDKEELSVLADVAIGGSGAVPKDVLEGVSQTGTKSALSPKVSPSRVTRSRATASNAGGSAQSSPAQAPSAKTTARPLTAPGGLLSRMTAAPASVPASMTGAPDPGEVPDESMYFWSGTRLEESSERGATAVAAAMTSTSGAAAGASSASATASTTTEDRGAADSPPQKRALPEGAEPVAKRRRKVTRSTA